jgi:hypothetical protein
MPGKIAGQIVEVSPEGNLITDIGQDQLRSVPTDLSVRVSCDEHFTRGIFPADHQEPEFTLLATVGGSGCLELQLVGENASRMLGLAIGQPVIVEWE